MERSKYPWLRVLTSKINDKKEKEKRRRLLSHAETPRSSHRDTLKQYVVQPAVVLMVS